MSDAASPVVGQTRRRVGPGAASPGAQGLQGVFFLPEMAALCFLEPALGVLTHLLSSWTLGEVLAHRQKTTQTVNSGVKTPLDSEARDCASVQLLNSATGSGVTPRDSDRSPQALRTCWGPHREKRRVRTGAVSTCLQTKLLSWGNSASPAFSWVLLLPTLRCGVCPKTGRLSPPAMDEHVTQAVVPAARIHGHGPWTESVA